MAAVGPVIARMRARASRETAWAYFADPVLRRTWWPDAELDVRYGGAVSERWSDGPDAASRDAVGTIDVLIAGHALGFRWRDGADEHDTAVLITLRSHDTETDIMVTETGFGRFADAFERTADAQQSWIELLTELTAALRGAGGAGSAGAHPPELAEPELAEPEEAASEEAEPELAEPELAEPELAAAPSEGGDPDGGSPGEPDDDSAESTDGAAAGIPDFDSILRGDSAER